ncbi:alpha/beta fold hydrolase [Kribbella solani]
MIDVAVTRLPATDRKHRQGSVAVLPGGPGGSGYLDPILRVVLRNDEFAKLNRQYDVIGFDPRGVGSSTKVACAPGPMGPTRPGPLTKAAAKQIYDAQVTANQRCSTSDPAFLGQLTTQNVARDVDRVRSALGIRALNLIGLSWGRIWGSSTAVPSRPTPGGSSWTARRRRGPSWTGTSWRVPRPRNATSPGWRPGSPATTRRTTWAVPRGRYAPRSSGSSARTTGTRRLTAISRRRSTAPPSPTWPAAPARTGPGRVRP